MNVTSAKPLETHDTQMLPVNAKRYRLPPGSYEQGNNNNNECFVSGGTKVDRQAKERKAAGQKSEGSCGSMDLSVSCVERRDVNELELSECLTQARKESRARFDRLPCSGPNS
jgi:hypothetical protein